MPPQDEIIYIDINTRGITTRDDLTGNSNYFTQKLGIQLDENKRYTIEVISFTYKNNPYVADVQPIILCDLSDPIIVDGFTSSILYKSNILTKIGNKDVVVSDITNNINFVRDLKYNTINSIHIQIVNSTDGKPFYPAPNSGPPATDPDWFTPINIILAIKNIA